jgi:four helix bundle protein
VSVVGDGDGNPTRLTPMRELRRAAISVPLAIAEGAGQASATRGARLFALARVSAIEEIVAVAVAD